MDGKRGGERKRESGMDGESGMEEWRKRETINWALMI